MAVKRIDVSNLPAPEPLQRIFEALESLTDDDYLIVVHRKYPRLLFEPLRDAGYQYRVEELDQGGVEITIWPYHNPLPVTHPPTNCPSD